MNVSRPGPSFLIQRRYLFILGSVAIFTFISSSCSFLYTWKTLCTFQSNRKSYSLKANEMHHGSKFSKTLNFKLPLNCPKISYKQPGEKKVKWTYLYCTFLVYWPLSRFKNTCNIYPFSVLLQKSSVTVIRLMLIGMDKAPNWQRNKTTNIFPLWRPFSQLIRRGTRY